MEEIWKSLNFIGYPEYEISNMGNVRGPRGLRKPVLNKQGYLMINFKRKCYQLHRLVAQAFVPNPDNLPIVNHIDQDKTNANASNLEWCTYKYNSNYKDLQIRKLETLINTLQKKLDRLKTSK